MTGARRPVARAARVVLGMSGVSSVMNPASRRGVGSQLAVVVVGWLVSVGGCLPAAAILGIWLSGWKAPPPDIIQGAATNPVLSSLFPILLTFVGLFLLVSLFWSWVLVRLTRGRRR